MPHISFNFSISRFLWISFPLYLITHTIYNPLTQLHPPPSTFPFSHFPPIFLTIRTILNTETLDHTRKIELVRYLMTGYVNCKVLDTLSEHANALASTAVASLEDEADQLSHFIFLPVPNDPVLIVPRHHGWYSGHCRSSGISYTCAVVVVRLVLCCVAAGSSTTKLCSGDVCCTSLQVYLGPVSRHRQVNLLHTNL